MSLILYILVYGSVLSWPPLWSLFSVLYFPPKIQSHLSYEDVLDDVIFISYLKIPPHLIQLDISSYKAYI